MLISGGIERNITGPLISSEYSELFLSNARRIPSTERSRGTSPNAGSGDKEKALGALEKSFDVGFRDIPAVEANPAFSSIRDDPRFQDLLRRMNFPQ